ncbi:alpha/beta hydrolase family protein [Bacteroidota bacterium]
MKNKISNWKLRNLFYFTSIIIILPMTGCRENTNMLCQGHYQTEEEALIQLERFKTEYQDLEGWNVKAKKIRKGILYGSGLTTYPEKCELKPIIGERKDMDGYSVENIAFECLPGFWVTGNLYRPDSLSAEKIPGILCPHGHWKDPEDYGRFREDMQRRCAAFARMGAMVFTWDMVGYGESTQVGHDYEYALALQLWGSIRSVDFLLTIPEVDKDRLCITGASGGGTQTFLLAAVDDRIDLSIPVVMVSAHFFGGCNCESGMPIHKSQNHETNNVEIAALAAPRPMLLVSDGDDWTKNTPSVEYPYIEDIYDFYGKGDNLSYAHFPDEKHDYGLSKRMAVYPFLAKHFNMDISSISNENDEVDEGFVKILPYNELRVFSKNVQRPDYAVSEDEITGLLFDNR